MKPKAHKRGKAFGVRARKLRLTAAVLAVGDRVVLAEGPRAGLLALIVAIGEAVSPDAVRPLYRLRFEALPLEANYYAYMFRKVRPDVTIRCWAPRAVR